MRHRRKSRGSALLLVVGLLTMIALLGGSFLVISRFNSTTSDVLTAKNQADQLAMGAMSKFKAARKDDGYYDVMGPYHGGTQVGNARWPLFIDAASGSDRDVAYLEEGYSNLYGLGNPTDVDGDGVDDAWIVEPGIRNRKNEIFYIAVKVTDLSSLINANVASLPTSPQMPPYGAPVAGNLKGLIPANYDALNSARCGGANAEPLFVHNNIALRPFAPTAPCLPFAICDELFLRWLSDTKPIEVGRLYRVTKDAGTGAVLPAATRKLLTSHSVSRLLVRNPQAGFLQRILLSEFAADPAKQQRLYQELVVAGASSPDAAHFVVNLLAYLTNPADPLDFTPQNPAYKKVYSVFEQVVISEGFAAHYVDPGGDPTKNWWASAAEVFNPTSKAISLSTYRLNDLGVSSRVLGPGVRVVLYDWGKGTGSTVTADDIFGTGRPIMLWVSVPGMGDFAGKTKVLTRLVKGDVLPMDSISGDDIGYLAKNVAADPSEIKAASRDDNLARAKSLLALYKLTGAVHTLGKPNGLGPADIDAYEGFDLSLKHAEPPNLGYVADVYALGLEVGGVDLPHQLKPLNKSITRGRVDFNGAIPAAPTTYPNLPWGALLGELLEQIPGDATQTDGPARTRIYGRVNINLASADVLKALPWPAFLDLNGNGVKDNYDDNGVMVPEPAVDPAAAAAAIVTARGTADDPTPFLSPGAVAIPLRTYAATLMPGAEGKAYYRRAVDSLYVAVSNVITVNSDAYAVTILVQLGMGGNEQKWRYVGVIDRSNCWAPSDNPITMMFSEVK